MTAAGVTFAEKMTGDVALVSGKAAPTEAMLRVGVVIDSLQSFMDDPDHGGTLEGHVRLSALASVWLPATGHVKLFAMGRKPGERIMHYEVVFASGGVNYVLSGDKYVYDDPGFDSWRDVTTLRTVVSRVTGHGTREAVWQGTLRLSLLQGARLLTTLRGRGGTGALDRLGAIFRFVWFFVENVLALYFFKRSGYRG